MDRKTCVAVLAGLVLGAPMAAAMDLNGFLPAAGEGTVALSFTAEGYDEFWVGETKVSDPGVGEVETDSIALWMRYGFTDRLAVVANVPYVDATSDGLGRFEDSGLQDLSALLLFRALEAGDGARHRLVLGGGIRTPLSDYEANLPVDLGDGTTDFLLRAVYQFESGGGFYFSQQVGYDLRGEDAPDGLPLYTEVGYSWPRVTVNGFYLDYSADGGTDIGDPGFTFPGNKDETERLGAKVFARLTESVGAQVSAFQTLDGRNSGDISGVSAGFTFGF
jgi:hypothetical protein